MEDATPEGRPGKEYQSDMTGIRLRLASSEMLILLTIVCNKNGDAANIERSKNKGGTDHGKR